jgi:hypothetical protein
MQHIRECCSWTWTVENNGSGTFLWQCRNQIINVNLSKTSFNLKEKKSPSLPMLKKTSAWTCNWCLVKRHWIVERLLKSTLLLGYLCKMMLTSISVSDGCRCYVQKAFTSWRIILLSSFSACPWRLKGSLYRMLMHKDASIPISCCWSHV